MGFFEGLLDVMVSVGEAMANCYKREDLEVLKKAEEVLRAHGEITAADNIKKIRFNATELNGRPTTTTTSTRSTSLSRTTFELSHDVERLLGSKFIKDEFTDTFEITRCMHAKVMYDDAGVYIVLSPNEYTLKRLTSIDENNSYIHINQAGHITGAENRMTCVYRADCQEAFNKILNVIR